MTDPVLKLLAKAEACEVAGEAAQAAGDIVGSDRVFREGDAARWEAVRAQPTSCAGCAAGLRSLDPCEGDCFPSSALQMAWREHAVTAIATLERGLSQAGVPGLRLALTAIGTAAAAGNVDDVAACVRGVLRRALTPRLVCRG